MKRLLIILLLFGGYTTFTQTLSFDSGETYALVVGISDYQNEQIPDLRFAHEDAMAFAAFLRSEAGGKLDDDHLKVLTNKNATAGKVGAELHWLLDESKEGDQVIIYFSGHGDVERKILGEPGFLLCWDAPPKVYISGGVIQLGMLQGYVSTLSLINKAKVLVITDACRSGKLAGSEIGGAQITGANLATRYANEIKILSCQPSEYSIEGEQWGGGRGAFSYHLVDGLIGLADNDADLSVNLLEIGRYLQDKVTSEVRPHNQLPMTVGDFNEIISRVDANLLAQVKKEKANRPSIFSATDSRGVESEVLASVDSTDRMIYEAFQKALVEKTFLEPVGACADYYYKLLINKSAFQKLHNSMRRNFAAALQDDAQQAINAYLLSSPGELQKRWAGDSSYEKYPKLLQRAAELLGSEHYMYNYLLSSRYYFEGLSLRLEGDAAQESDSFYMDALEKQEQALKLNDRGAFVFNELGVLNTRLQNDEAAVSNFEAAIERAPQWGIPYVNYSVLLHYNQERDKAAAYGEKALQLIPDNPQMYNFLAWVYGNDYHNADKVIGKDGRKGIELKDDFIFIKNTGAKENFIGRFRRSIELLKRSTQLDTNYLTAYCNLAKIYYQLDSISQSTALLDYVLQKDSNHIVAHLFMGDVYRLQNQSSLSAQEYLKAIKLVEGKDARMNALIHNNLGATYDNMGKYELSIECYKKAIELWPTILNPHLNLASYYKEQRQFEQAIWHSQQVIKYHPLDPRGYSSLAISYELMGEDEKARPWLEKAIEIDSTYTTAYVYLIDVYDNLKLDEQALEMIHVLEQFDLTAWEYYYLGRYYKYFATKKDYQKALDYFQTSIELDSNQTGNYTEIAGLYLYNFFDPVFAEKYFLKDLSMHPTSRYSLEGLGNLNRYYKKDYQKAADYYRRALQTSSNSKNIKTDLADLFYHNLKQPDSSIALLRNILDSDPKYGRAIQRLGMIYYNQENYLASAKVFQDALKADPGDWRVFTHLSACYIRLGEIQEAMEIIDKVFYEREKKPSPWYHYFIVKAYVKAGLNKEAEIFYNDLLRDHPKSYGNKIRSCHLLGKSVELQAEMEKKIKAAKNANDYYLVGSLFAYIGEEQNALIWLEKAFVAGYADYPHICDSSDLEGIRNNPDFQRLLDEYFYSKWNFDGSN